MRVWITSCLVLFGMVQIYHWMKHFTLPLPMFILGGALLAIASNYGKHAGWSFQQQPTESDDNRLKTPTASGLTNTSNWPNLNQSSATPVLKPSRSISFTIRRQAQEEVRNDKKS
jgi:hypothetical protein